MEEINARANQVAIKHLANADNLFSKDRWRKYWLSTPNVLTLMRNAYFDGIRDSLLKAGLEQRKLPVRRVGSERRGALRGGDQRKIPERRKLQLPEEVHKMFETIVKTALRREDWKRQYANPKLTAEHLNLIRRMLERAYAIGRTEDIQVRKPK